MAGFSEYRWDNPLLNRLLFETALQDGRLEELSDQHLVAIIAKAISRDGIFPRPSKRQLRLLHALAHRLGERWTGAAAAQALELETFYLDEDIQKLYAVGLIITTEVNHHQLAGGFRGLLREIKTLG